MSLPNLTIPQREIKLAGAERPPLAKANFRALIEIERVSGGSSYLEVISRFLSPTRLQATAVLLWGMTATFRYRQDLNFPLTEADRRSGFLVPESFLEKIPLPSESDYVANHKALLELLQEAGLVETPTAEAAPKSPIKRRAQ